MVTKEREGLREEGKYLDLPPYRRNGLIPGWSDVVIAFKLDKFSPGDLRLLRSYYRAQRRSAEGRPKKAGRIFKALERNLRFTELAEREDFLLGKIASYVRRASERRRTLGKR